MSQSPPRSARRHNLPARRVELVGRDRDSATARDLLLQAPGRIVTLTGAGGCGKTELALHVAAELLGTFRDGVWFVDLGPLQSGHLVPYAVAAALGCKEHARRAITETLVIYLAARDLLLVLDNCEHLVDACAQLAADLLSQCPRLRLLATSREHLRVPGEQVWRVPSLATPDLTDALAPAETAAYPAVQLFLQRARALQPGFALGAANASVVAAVCARLEGLPLALELAAARVPTLSLPEILDRLDDSFHLLVGGHRTAPAFARSWDAGQRLSADEAVAFGLAAAGQPDSLARHSARSSTSATSPLTPRQLEVAVLVAQGLSNRQIADRLVVTEAAAAKHIEHILDKLAMGSRAQIAAWVAERGLASSRGSATV